MWERLRRAFVPTGKNEKLYEDRYELELYPGGLLMRYIAENPSPQDRNFLVGYSNIGDYEREGVLPSGFVDEVVKKQLQVVEIGPGMSELLPTLGIKRRLPIAIDPLNYDAIASLLTRAQQKRISREHDILIQELLSRLAIYTNPRLVKIYNMRLEDACLKNPELKEVADVVIDVRGALRYSWMPEEAYRLESEWLMKNPGGKYYFHD